MAAMQAMLQRIAAQAGASPEDFEIVEETEFRRYLRGAWPDWTVKELDEVEAKLKKVEINSIPMLLMALKSGGLNDLLATEDEQGFSPDVLHGLKMQEKKVLPVGRPSVRRKAGAAAAHAQEQAARKEAESQQAAKAAAAAAARVPAQGQAVQQPSGPSRAPRPVPPGGLLFQVSGLIKGRQLACVHELPSLNAPEIGGRMWGDKVAVEAETFDGWVKLAGDPGWMLRVLQTKEGPETLLQPQGDLDSMASVELSEAPGPRRFEVVSRTGLEVRSAPSSSSQATGRREFGDEFFAELQTYDGWVRMQGGGGWLPSYSSREGPLLLCPLFEQGGGWREQRALALSALRSGPVNSVNSTSAVVEEVRAGLRTSVANRDAGKLRGAILAAKAWGVEADKIREAELLSEGLRRGWSGPAREADKDKAPGSGPPAEELSARAVALERLAAAAASGDGAALKRAREEAVAAGVPKKEIARVFALHSGGA